VNKTPVTAIEQFPQDHQYVLIVCGIEIELDDDEAARVAIATTSDATWDIKLRRDQVTP
jgi:hypothetical protein